MMNAVKPPEHIEVMLRTMKPVIEEVKRPYGNQNSQSYDKRMRAAP
jgi:hypothetical protein